MTLGEGGRYRFSIQSMLTSPSSMPSIVPIDAIFHSPEHTAGWLNQKVEILLVSQFIGLGPWFGSA